MGNDDVLDLNLTGSTMALDLEQSAADALFDPVHQSATPEARAAVISSVIRATHGRGVAGWGGHGEIGGGWEWIELTRLVPNPDHPREDWDVTDDELRKLAAAMEGGPYGQVDPIIVTELSTTHPRYVAGRVDLMIVKGHRRFAAARLARQERIKAIVYADSETGSPLSVPEAILYWLTKTESRKPPHAMQIVGAMVTVRWYSDQAEAAAAHDGTLLPTRRRIDRSKMAARLGVTESTISYGFTIAEEPHEVIEYLHEGLLLYTHALTLVHMLPDRDQRMGAVHQLAEINRGRLASGLKLLSVSAIRNWVSTNVLGAPTDTPAFVGGIGSVRALLGADEIDVDDNGRIQSEHLRIRQFLGARNRTVDAGTLAALELAEAATLLDELMHRGQIQNSPTLSRLMRALTAPEVVRDLYGQLGQTVILPWRTSMPKAGREIE